MYALPLLLFQAILSRLAGCLSNRETAQFRDAPLYLENLRLLSKCDAAGLPHPTTVAYLMRKLGHSQLENLRRRMVKYLLDRRVLEGMRVRGLYLVAVDGVQYCRSLRRLAHSTHVTRKDGTVEYHLNALEAKLVSPSGMVFSIASERIENPDGEYDKQDCELKAFHRLAERMKRDFPRTRMCLLLDSLYLNRGVIDTCRRNGWHYSMTFKEGSAAAFHRAAMGRLKASGHSSLRDRDPLTGEERCVRWANHVRHDLGYRGEKVDASVVLKPPVPGGKGDVLMYMTSIRLERKWVAEVLDGICRSRWKIENQGFNTQKNDGLGLEHAFDTRGNAACNYYLVVQIAHILLELIVRGSIFRRLQHIEHPGEVPRTICRPMLEWFGTRRRLMREIGEDLKRARIDVDIRFDLWRLELDTYGASSA